MKSCGWYRTAMAVTATGAALGALALGIPGASAESPLPDATDPAVAIVAPVTDEVPPCGQLGLALAAADIALRSGAGAAGVAIPAAATEALAAGNEQVLLAAGRADGLACEAIPAREVTTRCAADEQVTSALAGVPIPSLPVDPIGLLPVPDAPGFVGAMVDVVAAIEHASSAESSASGALTERLDCAAVQRSTTIPSFGGDGGAGGGVDLSPIPQLTDDLLPASPTARSTQRSPATPSGSAAAPSMTDSGSAGAGDLGAGATPGAAAPGSLAAGAVPASAGSDMSDTRRNVYRALFAVTALAAAIGWASPRRHAA